MDKRGMEFDDYIIPVFYVAVAFALGLQLLAYVETSGSKDDFNQQKNAVDIAASLNAMPLASGKIEIRHEFNPSFSYSIEKGKVSVKKDIEKIRSYTESAYSDYYAKKDGEFLILSNEQES